MPSDSPPGGNESAESLEKSSVRGTMWTLAGHGGGQALRLGSNLILTRLLAPEYFGQMVLVNVSLMALQLMSDVGIGPSIIHHKRGDDRDFLDTAWTLQVIRGFILWGSAVALAWPVAWLYGQPDLITLLPVAAVSALLSGFQSTAQFSLSRHLSLAKVTLLELSRQFFGVLVMVVWAWHAPSIWALIAGGIVGAATQTAISHFLIPGPRNRFRWEPEARDDILRFGKWIFISTALGFLANRGDRLILGKVMTMEELGLLSVALVLAQNVGNLINDIGRKVLFPAYARLADQGDENLRRGMLKARAALLAGSLPILAVLVVYGDLIVGLLWDERYSDAGPMLQILAAGRIFGAINSTSTPVMLAKGDGRSHAFNSAARLALLLGCAAVGGHHGGTVGVLVGTSASSLAYYPILAWRVRKYGVWMPGLDLLATLCTGALIALGFALR